MSNETELYRKAIEAIDSLNKQDEEIVNWLGDDYPAEYLYSIRMSEELDFFIPNASDELKVAVRAQHIARWRSPRSNYPMDRAGYLRWRSELYTLHAQYASEQMREAGIDEEFIESVATIIRDKARRNSEDTQALEDVACLVFLRHYLAPFVEKHEPEKLKKIIVKTWGKMSERAHARALRIPFEEAHLELIKEALGI